MGFNSGFKVLKCQHVISFDIVVAKTDRISQIRGDWGYGLGDRVSIPNSDRDIFPRHRCQTGSGTHAVVIGNCNGWRVKLTRLRIRGSLSLPCAFMVWCFIKHGSTFIFYDCIIHLLGISMVLWLPPTLDI